MHVVERVVAGLRAARVPAIGQRAKALADVDTQQMQAPQQRRRVEALQRDLQHLAGEMRVEQTQCPGVVQAFEAEEAEVPPQVRGEAVAFGPLRLMRAQPRGAVVEAALHLHHMRHRMHGPRHARVGGERAAAHLLGLRIEVALLQAEGVEREHVGVQRIGLVPLGQHARRAQPQVAGVTAEEVPQLRELQCERITRVVDQQLVPRMTRGMPAAVEQLACGLHMRTLARRRAGLQRLRGIEHALRFGDLRRLGEAEQEARLHHRRQQPLRIGFDGRVEVGQRRVVEGHHAPQRALGRIARDGRRRADGVAADVVMHGVILRLR